MPNKMYYSYHNQVETTLGWICSGKSDMYATLEDTYNPGKYRLATISSAVELSRNGLYEFEIVFDCQPQLFYTSGDNWLDFSGTTIKLINPSNYTALPKIVVSGNASTTALSDKITIDGVAYSFSKWSGSNSNNAQNYQNDVYLDAEIMDAYLADGTPISKFLLADSRTPTEFIKLGAGEHTISHNGDCTVKIQPRWWTI